MHNIENPTSQLLAQQVPVSQRILVVEDLPDARNSLQELLSLSLGLEVDTATDGEQGLQKLEHEPYSVVITDLRMPKLSGMGMIEKIQEKKLPVTVIVTTGNGSIQDAVKAMRMGAYDFLTKPADPQHLCLLVERALRERALQDEVQALRQQLQSRHSFQNVLSKNHRMMEIFEMVGHLAETTTTVMILGETGTGKEQLARAIHLASSTKRTGPMVAINCAALPETLLESELFGHEKGAFTGAASQRKGRFEQAQGGTLFLDEVGDVPPSMQVKLLRVLQERRIERVGSNESIDIDVRVIAATNRSLERLVKEGKFREDLYYRLNVVQLELPALRDRTEDIALLASHFVAKYTRNPSQPPTVHPDALEMMMKYPWPGNIRQLENAIERACLTAREGVIEIKHLPPEISQRGETRTSGQIDLTRPLPEQLAELTRNFEERYLRKALKKTRGHVGKCAKLTGLSRRSITDKIAQYQIDKAQFKG